MYYEIICRAYIRGETGWFGDFKPKLNYKFNFCHVYNIFYTTVNACIRQLKKKTTNPHTNIMKGRYTEKLSCNELPFHKSVLLKYVLLNEIFFWEPNQMIRDPLYILFNEFNEYLYNIL